MTTERPETRYVAVGDKARSQDVNTNTAAIDFLLRRSGGSQTPSGARLPTELADLDAGDLFVLTQRDGDDDPGVYRLLEGRGSNEFTVADSVDLSSIDVAVITGASDFAGVTTTHTYQFTDTSTNLQSAITASYTTTAPQGDLSENE